MITDEMIAEAAAKYNDALIQYWQNVEMEEHEFSSKFERKMRRLIWKVKYPYVHKALKSAACILIAFLISFASVMTFNVEARAAFTRWIREVYKDSIVYEFFGEKSETASLDYRVTWIPEGYEIVYEDNNETSYCIIYSNTQADKDSLVFEYYSLIEGRLVDFILGDDRYNIGTVKINDMHGEFYSSIDGNKSNNLIWFDEHHSICFMINSSLDVASMVKIAENIKTYN